MQKADLFSYLAAFVTIVLAIALTDLIQSTHRLIRARDRIQWDLMPLLAAAFVYLTVLSEFFSLWDEAGTAHFTFYELLWLMTVPTLVSLAAFAVLPDDVPARGLNLTNFYFANRRYLAALIALAVIGDLVRNLLWLRPFGYLEEPAVSYWLVPLHTGVLATLAVIWFGHHRRTQIAALVALLILGNIAFFQWAIDVAPKAQAVTPGGSP